MGGEVTVGTLNVRCHFASADSAKGASPIDWGFAGLGIYSGRKIPRKSGGRPINRIRTALLLAHEQVECALVRPAWSKNDAVVSKF